MPLGSGEWFGFRMFSAKSKLYWSFDYSAWITYNGEENYFSLWCFTYCWDVPP